MPLAGPERQEGGNVSVWNVETRTGWQLALKEVNLPLPSPALSGSFYGIVSPPTWSAPWLRAKGASPMECIFGGVSLANPTKLQVRNPLKLGQVSFQRPARGVGNFSVHVDA